MAERLSGGNIAVALLANTVATVFALFVLIGTLGESSGAHFNPFVTVAIWAKGLFAPPERGALPLYVVAQLLGAVAGAWLANAMFDLPVLQTSAILRGGWGPSGWRGMVQAAR